MLQTNHMSLRKLMDLMSEAKRRENAPSLPGIQSLYGAPVPSVARGILFSRVNGGLVRFTEPSRFPVAVAPPPGPALYVILVHDPTYTPRQFRPIYFGETGSADTRPTRSHENFIDWCRTAGGSQHLYVAYSWSSSSRIARKLIEKALIEFYNPVCNVQHNS
jgi:hypothetical protein